MHTPVPNSEWLSDHSEPTPVMSQTVDTLLNYLAEIICWQLLIFNFTWYFIFKNPCPEKLSKLAIYIFRTCFKPHFLFRFAKWLEGVCLKGIGWNMQRNSAEVWMQALMRLGIFSKYQNKQKSLTAGLDWRQPHWRRGGCAPYRLTGNTHWSAAETGDQTFN